MRDLAGGETNLCCHPSATLISLTHVSHRRHRDADLQVVNIFHGEN